jgi:energy-converting hydrogenase Eha subunit H
MKKRFVVILSLLLALCIGLSGCTEGNKGVVLKDPPFNYVMMVSFDGKSSVGMIIRTYSNEVMNVDLQYAFNYIKPK